MTYRFVWATGGEAVLTDAQRIALVRVAYRFEMTGTVTVNPMLGGDGAVMVDVGSMWLGVETDGYTHS